MKSYIAGTGSAQTALTRAPSASSARATASADPSASASGSRWQTVITRRRREQRGGHVRRHGGEVRRRQGSAASQRPRRCLARRSASRSTRRRYRRGQMAPRAVPRAARPRLRWSAVAGVGSVCGVVEHRRRCSGRTRSRPLPRSRAARGCSMTRVPRSALSSSRTCSSGMRLQAQRAELVADEGHRPPERPQRRPALALVADDRHPHGGMAQVRRRPPRR